jgi:heptosyltransferase-3
MNLFFHQAALGDFVLTFPILRSLCARADRTIVISSKSMAKLAATAVDGVSPMDIERREFTRLHAQDGHAEVSRDTRELFEQARRIVSFVSDGKDAWAGNVAALAPDALTVFAGTQPPKNWAGHVSEWQQVQLQRQGLKPESTMPVSRGTPEGPLVVHPGSGGRNKCWPFENFERLITQLRESGCNVQPVLGEVELATWLPKTLDRWCSNLEARVFQTPVELYELLCTASTYVGNDAGPTHLAAQLSLATYALFGPTDPARWAPLGPHVNVIAPDRLSPMTWLSVEALVERMTPS